MVNKLTLPEMDYITEVLGNEYESLEMIKEDNPEDEDLQKHTSEALELNSRVREILQVMWFEKYEALKKQTTQHAEVN